jgi:hypothetical protein
VSPFLFPPLSDAGMNNAEFRERLRKITCSPISEHVQAISDLSREYPHAITLKHEITSEDRPIDKYNCFEFALDLVGSQKIVDLALYEILVDSEFVKTLIHQGALVEIDLKQVRESDIVIYFYDGPTHAGKTSSGQIISKWGEGHLWGHDTYEVPASYGNETKYFSKITQETALTAFLDYARTKGAEIED